MEQPGVAGRLHRIADSCGPRAAAGASVMAPLRAEDAHRRTITGVTTLPDGEGFSGTVAAITSAFGDTTRRSIYLFVRDHDGVTASEVAQHFEVHPNVARHHLDKLAAGGYLEVSVNHGASSVGRPSKRYRSIDGASNLPPHRDDLLVLLLARLLPLVPPDTAEQLAYEVGAEYGRTLGAQMSPGEAPRSIRTAMQSIASALTAHGFAAHAAADSSDHSEVVRGDCPFGTVALEHPVLCAADRGMVEGLLSVLCGDAVAVQLSSKARGDTVCATFTA
jgi:predicted ArsR family transcriptional regulator